MTVTAAAVRSLALKLGNRKRWVWLSPPWLLLLLSVELEII